MERILSPEERYKRAQELYARRNNQKVTMSKNENTDYIKKSKAKKIFIQLMASALIYFIIFSIKNGEFSFSNNILEKTKYYISYDTNIYELYNDVLSYINNNFISKLFNNTQENSLTSEEQSQEDIKINEENTNNQDLDVSEAQIQEDIGQEQLEDNSGQNQPSDSQEQNVDNVNNVNNQTEELGQGGAEEPEEKEPNSSDQMVNDANEIKQKYQLQKPLEGTVSSRFGYRNSSSPNVPKNHTGIDIAVPVGTEVKSAIGGTVTLVSSVGDYGKHVKITTDDDLVILYAHCSSIKVKQGDVVEQGQVIALSGNTGNTTGPHLHFEIRKSGRLVNPEYVMSF